MSMIQSVLFKEKRWHVMRCQNPLLQPQVSHTNPKRKKTQKPRGKIAYSICNKSTYKFVWSSKTKKHIECSACKQCWIKSRKSFIKVTKIMLMSQMHFWLVDYLHKILIAFASEVVGKIFLSVKT